MTHVPFGGLCLALPILVMIAPALGQAFNIDCAGDLSTPPASSYGAGAGQPGYWNPAAVIAGLRDLSGNPTPTQLGGVAGEGIHDIPGATGDDEKLMESAFEMFPNDRIVVSNLAPGRYDVFAYSWGGEIFGSRTVGFTLWNGVNTFGGSVSFGPQWPGNQIEGVTFARIPIEVLPGINAFDIHIGGGGSKTFNVLNAIQIVPVPAPGALLVACSAGLLAIRRRR